jgi:hypothetical protein
MLAILLYRTSGEKLIMWGGNIFSIGLLENVEGYKFKMA